MVMGRKKSMKHNLYSCLLDAARQVRLTKHNVYSCLLDVNRQVRLMKREVCMYLPEGS